MIPLRDENPVSITPVATRALIAINVAVFAVEWLAGAQLPLLLQRFGIVPAELVARPLAEAPTLITSMFLHGGVMHLVGNLWFLYLFGDNVEERLGRARFVAFYLASGIGAGLLQVLVAPASPIPTIGASGAIAGVLGAYAVLWPGARVITLVLIQLVRLPAVLFMGFWFALQFFNGLGSLGTAGTSGGVAWWAHVGGFLVGAGVGVGLRRGRRGVPPAPPRQGVRELRTAGRQPGVIIRLDDRRPPTVH